MNPLMREYKRKDARKKRGVGTYSGKRNMGEKRKIIN